MKKKLKAKNYILLSLYVAVAITVTVITLAVNASLLSLVFVLLSLCGILLNSYMRGEGLLFLAAASAVFIYINIANKFYGEAALYFIFVSYYIISFFIYKKDFTVRQISVMSYKNWLIWFSAGIVFVPVYFLLLKKTGSNQPLLNSFSTCLNCIAVFLTAKKNIEQFIVWAVINVVQIILWLSTLNMAELTYLPIIIFNCFMVVINIYNFFIWKKMLKIKKDT